VKNLSLDNGRIEPEGAVLRGTRGWPPLGTLSFATGRFLLQTVFFVAELALTLVELIMHDEVLGLLSAYYTISSPVYLLSDDKHPDGLPTEVVSGPLQEAEQPPTAESHMVNEI
jgi:hypothetical protein